MTTNASKIVPFSEATSRSPDRPEDLMPAIHLWIAGQTDCPEGRTSAFWVSPSQVAAALPGRPDAAHVEDALFELELPCVLDRGRRSFLVAAPVDAFTTPASFVPTRLAARLANPAN